MSDAKQARIFRGSTSRGAHIRALAELLVSFLEALPDAPTHRRVALRDHLMALIRAYPELQLTTSDVAQLVAEDDDETIEDTI